MERCYITLHLVCQWSQIRSVYFLRFGWARANKATSLCFHLYPSIGASHSATGSRCMYDPLITCPLDDIGLSAVGLGSTNLGRSRPYRSDAPRHASTHSQAPPYLRAETPVAYHTDVEARPSLESNLPVASRIEPLWHVVYLWHIWWRLFLSTCFLRIVRSGCWAYPAPHAMRTEVRCAGGTLAVAWSWPLLSSAEIMKELSYTYVSPYALKACTQSAWISLVCIVIQCHYSNCQLLAAISLTLVIVLPWALIQHSRWVAGRNKWWLVVE